MPQKNIMAVPWVALLFLSCIGAAVLQQDLSGQWTVANYGRGISVPGQVPGSMYSALLDNKVIRDPLYRDNDDLLAWIGQENWTYSRYFEVSDLTLQSRTVQLVAEGIDTMSTVYINDVVVGTTDNMFVRYTFDVKSTLRAGNNSIKVSFQSAVDYASKRASSYPYTVPPVCPSPVQHGQCHVNMIRKEQCSFSWDWGPSFPTQGIWKSVSLQSFSTAVIEDVTIEAYPASGGGWEVRVRTFFSVSAGMFVEGTLDMILAGTGISRSEIIALYSVNQVVSFNISVPETIPIARWWPNGYGNQTLYNVHVIFTTSGSDEVSWQHRRIGFRTIELVQDPVSANTSDGLTFYFRVNGLPVFFKGSNWIPAESFQERITPDKLRILLQSAADAHMNSMRVWGGGVYESEDFYDLTDELGILIWQDLMFSVAMYPTDPPFLESVSKEVTHQVRRLMHRPSILLWAGSNENEAALSQNWFGTNTNYTLYYNDFIRLYVTTIMAIVTTEDPGRNYLTSSPSNGVESVREGYVAKDPSSEHYGDIHFYDYTMNQWVPDFFRVPRFTSEYGIEAWCNYETLLGVLEPADMSIISTQAEHRQHHAGGSVEMSAEIVRHLLLPPNHNNPLEQFKSFIYLTQINQAMSIKTQSEHYRRYQSTLLPDGRGLTMGALYWQLNDIWQAPTWASIDYSGRWKMLHYYALKFFNPILVSPFLEGNNLNIYVVLDEIPSKEVRSPATQHLRFEPIHNFKDILLTAVDQANAMAMTSKVVRGSNGVVTIEMYLWNNFIPLHSWSVPYKLNTTAEPVFSQSLISMMAEAGCPSAVDCFIHVMLTGQTAVVDNWLSLAELKDSRLQRPQIAITDVSQASGSDREFTVTLGTNAIAPFVWLEATGVMGRFSDNGFLMLQPKTTVQFFAWEDINAHSLQSALSVRSLMDVYS